MVCVWLGSYCGAKERKIVNAALFVAPSAATAGDTLTTVTFTIRGEPI